MENQLDEKTVYKQLANPRWMTLTIAVICGIYALLTILGVFFLFTLSTKGLSDNATQAMLITKIVASAFFVLYAIFSLLLFNNYTKLRKNIVVPKMLYFALSVFMLLSAANSLATSNISGVFLPLIILLFAIKIIVDLGKVK
ncbi:hypothetical protein HB847_08330 [Listeria booriae]|uniref:Uncharacterized protein n=1 Tax=Listeria booriae TaxID=1552123 RepID=A0A841Y4P4_9LIST|nr:hypothetical protein [Listeria booriae]MBC1372380.1 hypothetical protein [Listeria booriae]